MTNRVSKAASVRKSGRFAVPGLAALLLASCAPVYTPPQQVQSSNPSVTYKYHTDEDLLTVSQSASGYCNQYQAAPQPSSFGTDPDGSKVVVYQCLRPMAQPMPQPAYAPNLTYTYRTDQELLDALQNAQVYCASSGAQQVGSSIIPNTNGTRTVTFRCNPA